MRGWKGGGGGEGLAFSSKLCKNAGSKPICGAKRPCVNFSLSNFNFQGHILSTGAVA